MRLALNYLFIVLALVQEFCYDSIVTFFPFLLTLVIVLGEELEDYPESLDSPSAITGEAASRLLDAEDSPMDSTGAPSGARALQAATAGEHVPPQKRPYSGGSDNMDTPAQHSGPNLPPIYFSVQRKKLNKTVVRHLDGGSTLSAEGTIPGAPVNSHSSIGSFANSGDKRHNCTAHRFDHATLRNISMSHHSQVQILPGGASGSPPVR
jgi:hypothetical protein